MGAKVQKEVKLKVSLKEREGKRVKFSKILLDLLK